MGDHENFENKPSCDDYHDSLLCVSTIRTAFAGDAMDISAFISDACWFWLLPILQDSVFRGTILWLSILRECRIILPRILPTGSVCTSNILNEAIVRKLPISRLLLEMSLKTFSNPGGITARIPAYYPYVQLFRRLDEGCTAACPRLRQSASNNKSTCTIIY